MFPRALQKVGASRARLSLFQPTSRYSTQNNSIFIHKDSAFEDKQHAFQALQADTLDSLTISDASLGDLGAAWLAAGITNNQKLKTLHLDHNNFGPDGITIIAKAIEQSSIQDLRLSDKSVIKANAFKALTDMLKHKNLAMESLDIEFSLDDLTDLHLIRSLGEALESNMSVTKLGVCAKLGELPLNLETTHPGMQDDWEAYLERNQKRLEDLPEPKNGPC